jgi:hypothetical protein
LRRGRRLSGEERISLARAVLKDAPILILDQGQDHRVVGCIGYEVEVYPMDWE